jgi:L-lactate dehydrogenase complex protein LldE
MIRDYYDELLGDEPAYAGAASAVISRTYEFVEFLVKVLKVDMKQLGVRWPGHATYHFSCHLRGLGVVPEQNDVEPMLGVVDDLKVTTLERMDQCCGFGGTFAIKYAAISGTMVRDKVACIESTGAESVISNDAGCTMNISGACHRQGLNVRFVHMAELIAEGLGLMERPGPE